MSFAFLALGGGSDTDGANDANAPGMLEAAPRVRVLTIESIIQPVVAEFLIEQFNEADERGDELLVIELSTPGGMLDQTRKITSAMLEAETPIVVYVYPRGVHAASAGFFVLMASDIAAMAPGTNTGAAHPVAGSGQDIEGNMGDKVEQDTAAMIRSLAAARGRDESLAESAVLESKSFSASEALESRLIDYVVDDLDSLLAILNGREVGEGSSKGELRLTGATVDRVEMSPFQRARSAIVHPDIALMLLTLGSMGLYFEFSNPGASFPGVLGAIFVVLGLYGTTVLPVNYAGLALMGLSVFFFLAELKAPSFGLFGLGGVSSLVLGSLMLFRSADPALRVSERLVFVLAVVAVLFVGALSFMMMRSRSLKVATGVEGLAQETGVARTAILPGEQGKAFLHGEIWNAVSDEPVAQGQQVEVLSIDGLLLTVRSIPPVDKIASSE